MSRWARRLDASHREIVSALELLGWSVRDLSRAGSGAPDLLISKDGRTVACEVKTAGTYYARRLQGSQTKWLDGWQGESVTLRSAEEAAAWAMSHRQLRSDSKGA